MNTPEARHSMPLLALKLSEGLGPNAPDYAHCKHCGRVIVWDDWSYTHLDGWANCRKADNMAELDEHRHCEVLTSHPINPQPASRDEAMRIPMIRFVIGEDGSQHPWRKGDPMPVLTITG